MAGYLALLTPSVLGYVTLAAVLAWMLLGSIVNYRKLSGYKGPPLASISRVYIFWQSIRGRLHIAEFEALEKYGSPARLGPNLLITNDVDILRHMSSPRSEWRRSEWYEAMRLDPRRDSVFSTRDEKVHADLRSKMIAAYNGRDVDNFEPDIDARVLDLIDLIKTTYNGKSFDIAKTAQLFTLDVLSTVAFGAPFGYIKANKDLYGYAEASAAFLGPLELICNHRFFRRLAANPFVSKLLAPKDSDEFGIGRILGIARQSVAERFGPDRKEKHDMLGYFVSKGMNQLQCEVEANLQIVAGSDSTTTIFRCTLFQLTANPMAYMKLRKEIDAAIEAGEISFPVITYAEAQKLPYLQACIWEGIRMWPPLFGLKAKLAPKGGDTIKGMFFPEGTEIGTCDAAVCHNKKVFGEGSHIFRPDRWIEADPETRQKYQYVIESIFGTGRFSCLGKHIAMVELHKVFTELFRHFDWVITNPMRGIYSYAHGVHLQSNMNLTPYLRTR